MSNLKWLLKGVFLKSTPEDARIGLALLINSFCLMVSGLCESRSWVIGFLFSLLFAVAFKLRFRKRYLVISISVLCTAIILLAAFVKRDSTSGRLLIYKICLSLIRDHYLAGVGMGKFELVYLDYQYRYFIEGNYSKKELLLADNTKHACNDYLQLVVEHGFSGILLLVFFFILLYILLKKAVSEQHCSLLLLLSASVVISILTAAAFTHVFEYIVVDALLIIGVFNMILQVFFKRLNIFNPLFSAVVAMMFSYAHYVSARATTYCQPKLIF